MSKDEQGVEIIKAHQELVERIEASTRRIRALSIVTIVVALALSLSYASQLLLPATGVASVTVNLADPVNQAVEGVVLALALVWVYVGISNFLFSSRMGKKIKEARNREKELGARFAPGSTQDN
jgi:hypothetical protein